ncbi:MAG: DUF3465 domain-containing protein [Gammaproteobacteria bacterium]|nr:DUF3465 domain-containing protein [Gammaproteobacteria bacterium]MCB1923335.1 DUF3465 domain-containing protein [Gammaproteobacteria bacterium]
MKNKALASLIAVIAAVAVYLNDQGFLNLDLPSNGADQRVVETQAADAGTAAIAAAYRAQRSDVQVEGRGIVKKVLRDDNDGSRHQRFLLRLDNKQTLLVAHNIDLAPRIDDLREGDEVRFFGEYEWNNQGGVLHWTHRDPRHRHVDGWLQHAGRTYQ